MATDTGSAKKRKCMKCDAPPREEGGGGVERVATLTLVMRGAERAASVACVELCIDQQWRRERKGD